MDRPQIEGLKIGELVGSGGCGTVFRATDADGLEVVVKVFEGMAIQRPLLLRGCQRLATGGWPAGVVPVLRSMFDSRPAAQVVPYYGDQTEDGSQRPRTLQHLLDQHPGEETWVMVRAMADALAGMHNRRLAHGNLKPGNVFFDDVGNLLLGDWALGNMPGVASLEFTDALLYQPPEQLRDTDGYLEEKGYRWDVYAFGVLAYRLLTGRFPRCDETFRKVAPDSGETKRDGIAADLSKIAATIEEHDELVWPDEPANELEDLLREVITRCLELDPLRRPASMVEVVRSIERAEDLVAFEHEREVLLNQRRHASRRAWRANVAAGVLLGAGVVASALLITARGQLRREKQERGRDVRELRQSVEVAEQAQLLAETDARDARQTLAWESDRWLSRLESSRELGDRLFSWALAAGDRRLPALEGRESRLRHVEKYYREFLKKTGEVEELADERARAMMQLAEISLALGEAETAATRLNEALDAWQGMETGPEWQMRVATDRLLYAVLRQQLGEPDLEQDFAAARGALEELPLADLDAAQVKHLLAVLDLAQAKEYARRGEDGPALEQLMQATVALNELADERPDAAVIRSQLSSCYLSSAGILEGMRKFGDAREARTLAVEELKRLLETSPEDPKLRSELAGTYGAMAEAAVLSGDVAAAVRLSGEATEMLEVLRAEQPGAIDVAVRLAAQRGLMAGLYIDRGQAADAMKLLDNGIRLLEGGPASASPMARYRLALLWWQKGRLLGVGGEADQELELGARAVEALQDLEGDPAEGLRTEQIRRSLAYLLGDMAHAAEAASKDEEASGYFARSVEVWELLCKARPGQEEYDEGLAWSRARLKELGGD